MLVDEKTQTVVTHIRWNNITMFNYHDVDINDVQIGFKWKYYGVESIAISSDPVSNNNNINPATRFLKCVWPFWHLAHEMVDNLIQWLNISLRHLYKAYEFDFICNDRTGNDLIWRDRLRHRSKYIISINFLSFWIVFMNMIICWKNTLMPSVNKKVRYT